LKLLVTNTKTLMELYAMCHFLTYILGQFLGRKKQIKIFRYISSLNPNLLNTIVRF